MDNSIMNIGHDHSIKKSPDTSLINLNELNTSEFDLRIVDKN